jgi:serine/threonine-protein kinase RsbW
MTESATVSMGLASRAENVALIREMLAGLDDAIDLGGALEDVKAAVSEAANNVVVHAYGDEEGPMDVEITVRAHELEAIVRDYGVGIGPRVVDDSRPGRGIGLAVIDALADTAALRVHDEPGVEVVMRFPIPRQEWVVVSDAVAPAPAPGDGRAADALTLTVTPTSLCAAIFNRVVTGAAARAGFSIDRLSDVQLVVDALAAQLRAPLVEDWVSLDVEAEYGRLELRLGPLRPGGGASVVNTSSVEEVGPIINRLVDESASDANESGEILTLVMLDRRPSEPGTPPEI